jgi:hypothetical protein
MNPKILATAIVALSAAASQAVLVTFGGFTQNPGGALGSGLYAKHSSQTTFVGQILGTIQGDTAPTVFYCIAPDKNLPVPNTIDYDVTLAYGPMGEVLSHAFGLANANQNEAARQFKLWQMVGDDISLYTPSGGNSAALNAARSAAYSYTATGSGWYAIYTPKTGNSQTLVTASYSTTGLPVPEPVTIGLLASGLATALRRRRRR